MNEHHIARVRERIDALRKSRNAAAFWPVTAFVALIVNALTKVFFEGRSFESLQTDPPALLLTGVLFVGFIVHIATQTIIDGLIQLAEIALDHAYREIEERRDPKTDPKPWDFSDKK